MESSDVDMLNHQVSKTFLKWSPWRSVPIRCPQWFGSLCDQKPPTETRTVMCMRAQSASLMLITP